MGLAEKRLIGEIKEQQPQLQQELNTALGFEIPFELNLASFPEDTAVLNGYMSYRGSHGPILVVKALKAISADSFGKDAIKEKIKKIVYENSATSGADQGEKSVKIEGDTLKVRVGFYGGNNMLISESDMQKMVEGIL